MTAKNRQVSRMNENSESTFPAKFEASSGKNGSGCTALMCSLRRRTRAGTSGSAWPMLAPAENHKPECHTEQRYHSAHADHGQHRRTVARFCRVVLVTEQQQMIDGGPNFPCGRVDKSQPYVAGWIVNSEKIARDASTRRQQQNPTRVAEQFGLRVVAVAEIRRLRRGIDRLLRSRQEVPARIGRGPRKS